MEEVYKEYGYNFYVPMSQAYSLAVPVTIGCSWDDCLYCDLNGKLGFRFFGLDVIEEKCAQLKKLTSRRRHKIRSLVMVGGNPFYLPTRILEEVLKIMHRYFPDLEKVSTFARVDDVLRKTTEELLRLKSAGLMDVVLGIESGSDKVLSFMNKGVTRAESLRAMRKLTDAGFSYSTYIMLGLGGRALSEEHALETASLLSQGCPETITLVTLVLFQGARLIEKVRSREFQRLTAWESVWEERLLLEHLHLSNTIFNGTHKTNRLILKGRLPHQKDGMLNKIEDFLKTNERGRNGLKEMEKWNVWSVE